MKYNMHLFVGSVVVLSLALGCGRKAAPPAVEPKDARDGLTAALEAWKNGETKQSLLQRSPSIQFEEPKWDKGFRLLNYKIMPKDDRDGRMSRLTVQLSLKDKNGEDSESEIAYTVDTYGRIAIVRSDWGPD